MTEKSLSWESLRNILEAASYADIGKGLSGRTVSELSKVSGTNIECIEAEIEKFRCQRDEELPLAFISL